MMVEKHFVILCLAILLPFTKVYAQQDTAAHRVRVIHADLLRFERFAGREIQYLSSDVLVKHKNSYLLCDSAIIDGNFVRAMGHVRIVEGDSLQIFSDSILYDGDRRWADLKGNIVMKHKDQELFTSEMSYDFESRIASYVHEGLLVSEQAKLKSRRGYYHATTGEAFFKDSVIVLLQDGMNLLSDTLMYLTRESKVQFVAPTLIEKDSLQIYTDQGYYQVDQQLSYFGNNPRYKRGGQIAEARDIYHDAKSKQITLVHQAFIKDEKQEAKADSIVFNEETGDVFLYKNGYYKEGTRELTGDTIWYNRKSHSLDVKGETQVLEEGRLIRAAKLLYNGSSSEGLALGKVIVSDTSDGYRIYCDTFSYKKKEKKFKAIGSDQRAYIALKFDKDSLYISADSLLAGQIIEAADTFQNMRAWGDVKIWNVSLSALCDSLYFSGKDSSFYLFDDPVMWSDSAQLSGDSIRLVLEQKKMKDLFLFPKGFIISRDHIDFNNQIKGKEINGHFANGKMDFMLVEGNAESMYFIKDEGSGYIGGNFIQCSSMKFIFNDSKKVESIFFYNKPKGVIMPISEGRKKFLEGYRPRFIEKPESVQDIIKWTKK